MLTESTHASRSSTVSPDSLIFDLDGTLWDSAPACALGWNRALEKAQSHRQKLTAQDLGKIMGLTFDDAVKKLVPGISDEEAKHLGKLCFEAEVAAIEEQGGTLYPGVLEGLKTLSQHYPIFLVSNCLEPYLLLFLRLSGVKDCFKDWECYGRTLKPKSHNISLVVSRNGLQRPVYIGDTLTDQNACIDAKVVYCHVDYGFGQPGYPCQRFADFRSLTHYFLSKVG